MILLDPLARPVIAHRGASGCCPENTLLAFRRGLEQGADGLELDVRLTADRVPVVIHDATVDRTTNGTGAVATFRLEDLQTLDAGEAERIPTLAEVLEAFPGVALIVDIKDPLAGVPVAEVIEAGGAEGGGGTANRVVLGAFEHRTLRPCRAAGLPTWASRRETTIFWLSCKVRWPRTNGPYHGFAVPEHSNRLRVVDERFVKRAVDAGKPVHVWTVDDRRQAERLRSLGVSGIITNFPERMQALPS